MIGLLRGLVAKFLYLLFVVQSIGHFQSDLGVWLDARLVVLARGGVN